MRIRRSRSSAERPMPLMADTGSAAKKRCSVPGRTMVSPNGLSRSLAIFATVLLQPTPMEHVTPSAATRSLIRRATSSGSSGAKRPGVISIKASSMDTRSTRGVSSARIAMTCALTSR